MPEQAQPGLLLANNEVKIKPLLSVFLFQAAAFYPYSPFYTAALV